MESELFILMTVNTPIKFAIGTQLFLCFGVNSITYHTCSEATTKGIIVCVHPPFLSQ